MKVLIWFVCLLISSIITVSLSYRGIQLGALPTILLYSVTFWLARTLCKGWEQHKQLKKISKTPPVQKTSQTTSPNDTIRFCRKCGHELLLGEFVCKNCGTRIAKDDQ